MSFFISDAYANAAAPAGPSMTGQLVMLGIFALVFYFLLLRPQDGLPGSQKPCALLNLWIFGHGCGGGEQSFANLCG